MGMLSIRIDDKLEADLTEFAREEERSKSDLARRMIRAGIAQAKFERARRLLVPLGERAGYLTDEDVFRDFS